MAGLLTRYGGHITGVVQICACVMGEGGKCIGELTIEAPLCVLYNGQCVSNLK